MAKTAKAALLVLFVAGAVAALGKVFIWGEAATNYGAYTPWGLWVGLYILLVGAAAGAAWTGIYAAWSQGGEPNRMTTISFIIAGACLAFGLGFIGTDLGKPMKGISIFLSPTFSSKLAWASWIYGVFFICLAGYLFSNAKRTFMYLAGVAAFGFLMAEGLFFGGMPARVLWNGWLTPLSFITSAIAAGSAAVYVAGSLNYKEVIAEEGYSLKKILLYSLIANAAVEAIHIIFGGLGGGEKALLTVTQMSSVPFIAFVLLGIAAPIYLLSKKETPTCIGAGAMAFVGLAAYKYSFIRYGFATEPLPGLTNAFHDPRLSLAYIPSAVEWVVALGFIAGALLAAGFVTEKYFAVKQP